MAGKNNHVLVRTILAGDTDFFELFLSEDIPVICVNKEAGTVRSKPFKALYNNNHQFWLQESAWEFFISGENFAHLKEKAEILKTMKNSKSREHILAGTEPANGNKAPSQEQGFGDEYAAIAAMTESERIQHINESKKRLDALIVQKPRNEDLITEALVETTRDAALSNHATLMSALHLADDEAKKLTQEMVESTSNLVKSSSRLVSPEIFNNELMNTLVAKSNGTVIQHMTRVFLNGIAFLSHYNELVSSSSFIIKLRISFDKDYRSFYQLLLPHLPPEKLNLERVFLGGMRAISENNFFAWATGFLIHDIGKASAVEYHEGEAAYNRDIVVDHVKVGYSSIMNKTNYPKEAALITGYHHEYYGDSAGYGYFRAYLEQYRKMNPKIRQDYCISYELEPMLDYRALAFFPAKILEIIDVYDSLTDPNRKYRKPMTPEEALAMMREEFLVKHHKIDLILFDIFANFVEKKPAGKK